MNLLNAIITYKDIYYFQINITCIILLLFILIKWSKQKRGDTIGVLIIRIIIIISMLFCISDLVAGVLSGHEFVSSMAILYFSNIVYFISITCVCVAWTFYSMLRNELLKNKTKKYFVLLSIPFVIFFLLLLTTPFTGFIFAIDKETFMYSWGPLIWVHWLVSIFYIVYGIVKILMAMSKEKSKVKRKEMVTLIYFPIAPVVMMVVQLISKSIISSITNSNEITSLSCIQIGLVFAILLLYSNEQSSMVQTDELTKLNNRRGLDYFLETHILHTNNYSTFTFLMIDVNKFKEINDNYGHIIGDEVLKKISEILRVSCENSSKRLFLCRYGGDEFVIVGIDVDEENINIVKDSINKKTENINIANTFEFNVSVSIGESKGICQDFEDVEHLLRVADEDMYEAKKKYKIKM